MDKNLFSIQDKCFKLVGLYGPLSNVNPKLSKVWQGLNLFGITFLFYSASKFIWENIDDVLASADASGPQFTECIAMSKLVVLLTSKEKLYDFMDEIKILTKNVDKSKIDKMKRVNQFDRMTTFMYLASTLLTGGGYIVKAIVSNVMDLIKGNCFPYIIPFKASFHYDLMHWPAFLVTYAIFSYIIYAVIFISVSVK